MIETCTSATTWLFLLFPGLFRLLSRCRMWSIGRASSTDENAVLYRMSDWLSEQTKRTGSGRIRVCRMAPAQPSYCLFHTHKWCRCLYHNVEVQQQPVPR